MAENKQAPEQVAAQPTPEKSAAEQAVSKLKDNPDALRDLAKDPKFLETLDKIKSNPAVKEVLDKMWNAALVDLFRKGFQGADKEKQVAMVKELPVEQRTVLVFHVRSYDRDNGSDLPPTNPEDQGSLEAVAASMRKSIETRGNEKVLESGRAEKSKDPKAFMEKVAEGQPESVRKALEKTDPATMTNRDVLRLRAEGADLSKLFLVKSPEGLPCAGKSTVTEGNKFVVDFSGNKEINASVGAADIIPDNVTRVKINGTEGVIKPTNEEDFKNGLRPGFYDVKTGRYLPIFDGYTIEVTSTEPIPGADPEMLKKAHMRQFEETVSDDLSDQIREAMTAQHYPVRAQTPTEAEALANVLVASLGLPSTPEEVSKLKAQLLGEGVDLGKQGPYADKIGAFHEKIAKMSLARGGKPEGIPIDGIVSGPAERSPSGSTLCSKTARENAERIFGVRLPRGNAIDVQNSYGPAGAKGAESSKGAVEVSSGLPPSNPSANFADVFTGSNSRYGHRCVAFRKGGDGEWMILDPYVGKDQNPIPLANYPRPILKAACYSLPKTA